ncbi:MAG: low affinity iron permease family protein [Ferruginibacter sp.]
MGTTDGNRIQFRDASYGILIQKSQNKDSMAIHLKLNKLVTSNELASNHLFNVEGMTEEELKAIRKYYSKLGELLRPKSASANRIPLMKFMRSTL